ncbi:MAG: hypothetical protein ACYS9X_29040 [Planctomycetota bacterium]|jgi:hypothetical protein
MAGEPKQNTDGDPVEVLVLPVDPAAIRRRVVRLVCAMVAIGLAAVGCAWYVYAYYGEAAPEMPLWKFASITGAVVAVGTALVFAISRLHWRRTTVAIAADSLIGPPLDPREALLSTPRGHMTGLPYDQIGRVVLEVRGGRVVSAAVFQWATVTSVDGIAIPDYIQDIHLALLAIDERAGDSVKWQVPGRLRMRLREIGREEAVRLIQATAEAARGSGRAERAETPRGARPFE